MGMKGIIRRALFFWFLIICTQLVAGGREVQSIDCILDKYAALEGIEKYDKDELRALLHNMCTVFYKDVFWNKRVNVDLTLLLSSGFSQNTLCDKLSKYDVTRLVVIDHNGKIGCVKWNLVVYERKFFVEIFGVPAPIEDDLIPVRSFVIAGFDFHDFDIPCLDIENSNDKGLIRLNKIILDNSVSLSLEESARIYYEMQFPLPYCSADLNYKEKVARKNSYGALAGAKIYSKKSTQSEKTKNKKRPTKSYVPNKINEETAQVLAGMTIAAQEVKAVALEEKKLSDTSSINSNEPDLKCVNVTPKKVVSRPLLTAARGSRQTLDGILYRVSEEDDVCLGTLRKRHRQRQRSDQGDLGDDRARCNVEKNIAPGKRFISPEETTLIQVKPEPESQSSPHPEGKPNSHWSVPETKESSFKLCGQKRSRKYYEPLMKDRSCKTQFWQFITTLYDKWPYEQFLLFFEKFKAAQNRCLDKSQVNVMTVIYLKLIFNLYAEVFGSAFKLEGGFLSKIREWIDFSNDNVICRLKKNHQQYKASMLFSFAKFILGNKDELQLCRLGRDGSAVRYYTIKIEKRFVNADGTVQYYPIKSKSEKHSLKDDDTIKCVGKKKYLISSEQSFSFSDEVMKYTILLESGNWQSEDKKQAVRYLDSIVSIYNLKAVFRDRHADRGIICDPSDALWPVAHIDDQFYPCLYHELIPDVDTCDELKEMTDVLDDMQAYVVKWSFKDKCQVHFRLHVSSLNLVLTSVFWRKKITLLFHAYSPEKEGKSLHEVNIQDGKVQLFLRKTFTHYTNFFEQDFFPPRLHEKVTEEEMIWLFSPDMMHFRRLLPIDGIEPD